MYKKTNKRTSKNVSMMAENTTEKTRTAMIENTDLKVTGVSRSGRVRKKSSKLLDYESGAEEIERPRRRGDASASTLHKQLHHVQHQQQNSYRRQQTDRKADSELDSFDNEDSLGAVINSSSNSQNLADSETEANIFPSAEGYDDSSVDTSGTDLDEDELLDEKSSVDETTTGSVNSQMDVSITSRSSISSHGATGGIGSSASTSQKSLYMLETFAKKRKTNYGRVSKAGRKDKGKARFSAYMLWAREVRPDLMKANPHIVFSQLSTKLSDLWATVPYTEKYMWKQKAKRMAMLARNSNNKDVGQQKSAQIKTSVRKTYINKRPVTPPVTTKETISAHETNSQLCLTPVSSQDEVASSSAPSTYSSLSTLVAAADHNKNVAVPEYSQSAKNLSSQPLDVAAHLKLLGESLSIIGQRLKEHEGQIAVSGSLSVLLDTLLCSLGPLLCLTQQVEEMNGCSKETLNSILDNIAYIMPGL